MVVITRWLWTAVLRVVAFADHARWIVLSLVLALTGVIGLAVPTPPALAVALAVVSVVLVVLEVRAHHARLREIQFVDRSGDGFADVRAAVEGSDRFEFVGTSLGHVVVDRVATRAIAAGQVTAQVADSAYRLPRELSDAGTAFRRRRVASGRTYNGHLLGLDADLGGGAALLATHWRMVPARYWDHLGSDILAMKDVLQAGRLVSDLGRALYVDRHGRLRDFGESWLLNGIGTSVLALTTDARLVVVSQSNHNESSQGLLAPSGSGSLEPVDFEGATSLRVDELAAHGALRELSEEAGVARSEVRASAFLGFGRWLEKSAKPELLTLALLSIDSHEVRRRRVPGADRPYTLGIDVVRLNPARDTWIESDPLSVLEVDAPHRLSVPLVLGLHLLAQQVHDQESPVRRLVDAALGAPTGPGGPAGSA
ncbi:hypothetical protein [Actinotalea subterranea]|uniref:hypothetical protein n=1 Tax=Actinotalea subterranea TaxID=2607497 RepID=UPI0011ED48A5|nr:hypothetical protein [Actinotalea subterranea]